MSLQQLYREALRALRPIPYPSMRQRMSLNIREMIEIQAEKPDRLAAGWEDVRVLQALTASRPELVAEMFKSFVPIAKKEVFLEEGEGEEAASIEGEKEVLTI